MDKLIRRQGKQYSVLGFFVIFEKLRLKGWRYNGPIDRRFALFHKGKFDAWLDAKSYHIAFLNTHNPNCYEEIE
jgi:hypothetical protein